MDLRPGELGRGLEHAFVEGYAAVDLGAGLEAVLVADLGMLGTEVLKRGEGGLCVYFVWGALALDLKHFDGGYGGV